MIKFTISLLFIAVIGYCGYYCITQPAHYKAVKTGKVLDKFRSPHEKVADEFILIVRYDTGVEQESVSTDTYYKCDIGDSISLNKTVGDNDMFLVCAMVGVIGAVIFLVFLLEFEEPKPKKVEPKDKFNFNDYEQ